MSNYNESTFGTKLKNFFSNRAAVVTILTMVVAIAIVVAVSISANRSKAPAIGGETNTTAQTTATTTNANPNDTPAGDINKETLPVYHGQGDKPSASAYEVPVEGKLFKEHDPTIQVYSATMGDYRVHLGVDIATKADAPVYAAADGKVEKIWEDSLMGYCVAITHNNDVVTVYKNLAKDMASGVAEGVSVKAGQEIGKIGDTAILEMADEPHLHFEMTVNGLAVDPLEYFDQADVDALSKDTAYEDSAVTTANGKSGK